MRTKGIKNKKINWCCVITAPWLEDQILHDKEYSSLQEISDDLKMSYSKVFDLSPKGRNKTKSLNTFIYAPKITITKVEPKIEPSIFNTLSENVLKSSYN